MRRGLETRALLRGGWLHVMSRRRRHQTKRRVAPRLAHRLRGCASRHNRTGFLLGCLFQTGKLNCLAQSLQELHVLILKARELVSNRPPVLVSHFNYYHTLLQEANDCKSKPHTHTDPNAQIRYRGHQIQNTKAHREPENSKETSMKNAHPVTTQVRHKKHWNRKQVLA
jgi:hypothetical protein